MPKLAFLKDLREELEERPQAYPVHKRRAWEEPEQPRTQCEELKKEGERRVEKRKQTFKLENIMPGSSSAKGSKGIPPLLALKKISESPCGVPARSGLLTERAACGVKLTPREPVAH